MCRTTGFHSQPLVEEDMNLYFQVKTVEKIALWMLHSEVNLSYSTLMFLHDRCGGFGTLL